MIPKVISASPFTRFHSRWSCRYADEMRSETRKKVAFINKKVDFKKW